MKITTLRTLSVFCGSALVLAGTVAAFADESAGATPTRDRSCTGVITALDPKEKTVTIKRFWFSKTFNVPDNCAIAVGDKKDAALNNLRRGQKIEVTYKDARGVLVANRIVQEKRLYAGSVQFIDPEKHVLKVSRGGFSRTFGIPDDCQVVLKDNKSGSLDDVKAGHTITVVYETPGDSAVARQIQQTSATYVGTLDAIDASARTVKAKHFVDDKKFNLASDCKIVLNGKPNASLNDLRLGQKLAFSYDEVDGVWVVNRIALAESTAEAHETAAAARKAQK